MSNFLLSLSHAWSLQRYISLSKSEIIYFEFFHFLKHLTWAIAHFDERGGTLGSLETQ